MTGSLDRHCSACQRYHRVQSNWMLHSALLFLAALTLLLGSGQCQTATTVDSSTVTVVSASVTSDNAYGSGQATSTSSNETPATTSPDNRVGEARAHNLHSRLVELVESHSYDGWYNNPNDPELGSIERPLLRLIRSQYPDGAGLRPARPDGPNPFEVALGVTHGPTGMLSYQNRTALFVFFGQQVVEEILDAQRAGCPVEYNNIKIPKCHYLYDRNCTGGKEMPFVRSRFDKSTGQAPGYPRQQLNEITPWIDGGLFYGVTKAWADALRSFVNGTLECEDPPACNFPRKNTIGLPLANPPPPAIHRYLKASRFYKIGNPRGNENPMLLAMGITWFRNHNYHAKRIRLEWEAAGKEFNDELIFNRARQWTIAEHQAIVLYNWLPALLNRPMSPYRGYQPTVNPGVSHVFQSAAMRFGHTLVPPVAFRAYVTNPDSETVECHFRPLSRKAAGGKGGATAIRTCQSFWRSPSILSEGHATYELLLGLSKQICEREDNIVTEDLQGKVFGPLEFSRRDLMAVNIARGRDHGIPDYNTVREHFGLPRVTRFSDINNSSDPFIQQAMRNLSRLYNGSLDNIDLWPAGILETTPEGPGETFAAIISDQFDRIRNADRFWFENHRNGLFTAEEIQQLRNTTFRDIIVRVANADWLRPHHFQQDVFHFNREEFPKCQPPPYNTSVLDKCSEQETFDYFDGSGGPYIGTFVALGLYLVLNVILVRVAVYYNMRKEKRARSKSASPYARSAGAAGWAKLNVFTVSRSSAEPIVATELGVESGEREVVLGSELQEDGTSTYKAKLVLTVYDEQTSHALRKVSLQDTDEVKLMRTAPNQNTGSTLLLIRTNHASDILLEFRAGSIDRMVSQLKAVIGRSGRHASVESQPNKVIRKSAFLEVQRQAHIEEFMKVVFRDVADASKGGVTLEMKQNRGKRVNPVRKVFARRGKKNDRDLVYGLLLSKEDFAKQMGMKPCSLFITQIFEIIDADNSGFISFQEFVSFMTRLTKGTDSDKAELLFEIYDLNGDGEVSLMELKQMLMLSADGQRINSEELDSTIESLLVSSGLSNKATFTREEFTRLFTKRLSEDLQSSEYLAAPVERGSAGRSRKVSAMSARSMDSMQAAYTSVEDARAPTSVPIHAKATELRAPDQDKSRATQDAPSTPTEKLTHLFANYRLHIFWGFLYTIVTIAIFGERAYYYSVERESGGLRRICGYGVSVTRGAASAMMFTYSSMLVSMCRHIITFLRETFLHHFVPFDSAVAFHKFCAMQALFYTVVHCVGHAINFYHITTQPPNDAACYFRDYFHASHETLSFQYWMFGTITGLTGFLLVMAVITLYVCAMPYVRRHLFRTFWNTHHLYIAIYGLIILHGSGRLVQPPIFQWFFIAPAVLFTIDKLISFSSAKLELSVESCERLPSGVTHIRIKKPASFNYLSGQWARFAVIDLNPSEYHPFTITSAPHEQHVDFYIRAVGPFTRNVRRVYDPDRSRIMRSASGGVMLPKIFLDGPYGEGHQDWLKYDVAVLVGGGIGVTPFASIMKDLVHKQNLNMRLTCQKVYFLWVTRTQRQFEWMTDIIREVEEKDQRNLLDVHIFITQFYQRFDLRTCMLYICEKHFQKTSKRSLFTGLRSETHFGRPNFQAVFELLRNTHSDVSKIGVFSCGPPPMTSSVEKGVTECNLSAKRNQPLFVSKSENF